MSLRANGAPSGSVFLKSARVRGAFKIGLVSLGMLVPQTGALAHVASHEGAAAIAPSLLTIQRDDARLQNVGWRLTRANAAFCSGARPSIGLLVQDARDYSDPAALRAALGIEGNLFVGAAPEASPAFTAGLRVGQEITAMNGKVLNDPVPVPGTGAEQAQKAITDALARNPELMLTIRNGNGTRRDIPIEAVPICPARFALATGGHLAQAGEGQVIVGQHFTASSRASDLLEEEEFAAIVAHELAHVLLGHSAWLDRAGRSEANIRASERLADRMAVWLLANAGYGPEALARLLRGWGRRNDPGKARLATHDSWDDRAAKAEKEVLAVRAEWLQSGRADWRDRFGCDTDSATTPATKPDVRCKIR